MFTKIVFHTSNYNQGRETGSWTSEALILSSVWRLKVYLHKASFQLI